MRGIALTRGCFSKGVRHVAQIGMALWAGAEQELDRSSMQGSDIEAFSENDLETNPKRAVLTQQNLKLRTMLCASKT